MEKIEVFAESNSVAIHVATFHSDELYNKCLPLIEEFYLAQGYNEITESAVMLTAVEEAKQVLKKAGYYVENLWQTGDVKARFNIDDERLMQEVLDKALTNEATMEQIHFAIDFHGNEMIDLFEYPESQPDEVKVILERFANKENTYEACEALVEELENVGYTCEYGLDATPYNLKKI